MSPPFCLEKAMKVWTHDRDEELKRLHNLGYDQHRISIEMSLTTGQVNGRRRRLGLTNYGPPVIVKSIIPHELPPIMEMDDNVVVGDNGISIVDLRAHHCRWPLGGDRFCGKDREGKRPYCKSHNIQAFLKIKD